MKLQHSLPSFGAQMHKNCHDSETLFAQSYPDGGGSIAVSAARQRLAMAAERCQQRREIKNGVYYGAGSQLEETIEVISGNQVFDAIVTRNHYGSLVLNARRTLFIDVDIDHTASTRYSDGSWSETLNDLCTVLASQQEEGFRIYRTAAGYRVLATAHEFIPGSEQSTRLMNSVSADACFVGLCSRQNSFRARLTPKPWRCGITRPPFAYPRLSLDHESRFAAWLSQYDHRCQDRSTCKFLAHVGSMQVHDRVAPIIEVHDRETKAQSNLPLA
jgi:hypothetical protein